MARKLIIGFALIAPILTVMLWDRSIPFAIAVLALSHLLLLAPTLLPNSQLLGPVVTHFETVEREVWLTLDDGPSMTDTLHILELLKRHDGAATFFVKGRHVLQHPALSSAIMAAGSSIGNHSHTHPSGTFWMATPAAIRREIAQCSDAIKAATGTAPVLFRAPVGHKNPFVHPVLEAEGLDLIGWNCRAFDGVRDDSRHIADTIVKQVRPGSIIMMHEGRNAADGRAINLESLRLVVEVLAGQGYRFVLPRRETWRYGRSKVSM